MDELLISRVAVEHNGGDGIVLDNCHEDARICDSLINYNAGTGLDLRPRCHDVVVSANQFETNRGAVRCADGFNLTVIGNNMDDHSGHGLVVENTHGSVVAGNMIEQCTGDAAVLRGKCDGTTLSANTLTQCREGGVQLVGVKNLTLSASTFDLANTTWSAVREP